MHVEADKELADRFRMKSDKWECDTCMIQNSQTDNKCLACETPKPGSQTLPSPPKKQKTTENTQINPLASVKKATTTTVFNLNPSLGSGSSLFQGSLNIPGFSFNTKQTESKPNLINIPILPPPLPSITATSINSILPPSTINTAPIISTADTNVITSTTTTATAKDIAIVQPSASTSLPFSLTHLTKEEAPTTTSSLTPIQPTQSLQPASMAPISPPRSNPALLPITPLKSVEEEAMEVIPFIGTLTTPIKGSSSVPANSPFNFLKSEANPLQPILPPVQTAPTQFGTTNPNPISFPGIQGLTGNSFLFNKTEIPSAFQFSGNNPTSGTTARQIHADDGTGQKMKLFQFEGVSQPSGPFQASVSGITKSQSNSQPQNSTKPIFPTNQGQILSNLFSSQDKPSSSASLFSQHPHQSSPQQQTPNFSFSSQVLPGPSMFNQDPPQNPVMNVFKPSNIFSPTQKPGFTFSATGSTPQTPAFPFPPTQLTNRQITPTTPQTPTYGSFSIGSSQPSSEMSKRVMKTAKRRLPHK
ncbi:Nuclear pore complex protein [Oopsacas minuta]|uniref:Nuclear pore complex protein Nup153 n=1 Tax=Oopsacas minuta TaxID=111878 RepID=A0AAV7JJ68_9METZ|nr:Nuclear pore complex protein [Oopsacas minuta]